MYPCYFHNHGKIPQKSNKKITKYWWMKPKKMNLKKKNQISLGEPCKPRLISQTRNPLNYRSGIN